jgi:hypothetical protein
MKAAASEISLPPFLHPDKTGLPWPEAARGVRPQQDVKGVEYEDARDALVAKYRNDGRAGVFTHAATKPGRFFPDTTSPIRRISATR